MGNFEKPPSSPVEREVGEALEEYGKKLEKPAFESEGFLYVPAKNIEIIPPGDNSNQGVINIYEPSEKVGTEEFDLRDSFEKSLPVGKIEPIAERENKIYSGEVSGPPFTPELGGGVCLTVINIYETKEGSFVLIPIHPKTEQKYGIDLRNRERAKLSGTNMLRGTRFPTAGEIIRAAQNKVASNLDNSQRATREEKVVSQPRIIATGLWNVRIVNREGKYSEIKKCHVHRDPKTATLDLLLLQKQFVFTGLDNLNPQENLPGGLKRVNALVSLENLRSAKEDEPLLLEKMYYGDKLLESVEKVPENYKSLFDEEDSKCYLARFKATSALEAFNSLEEKVVRATSKDLTNEIREKIGELFERLMSKVMGMDKNSQSFQITIPEKNELALILEGQPEKFKSWAMELKGKDITVKPDFVLEDGTFIEVKAGGKLDLKPEKREQLFRMVLYKLLKKEEWKIRIITLEGETSSDPDFEFLKYENVSGTEWGKNISERDLKPIRMWQKDLPR